ncbi:MAG: SLC13 family permease [Thermoplasmata archaeon]
MYDKALAVAILAACLVLIATERIQRALVAMMGAMAVLALGILSPEDVLDPRGPVHWEALGLIFGMFVMIHVLREVGFFKWIGLRTLMMARFRVLRLFVLFSALSAFLAAFMDSITVLMFMVSLTMEITRILRVSPLPFILGEITSANIGGSATMVGDPPNIVIGTALHYSFSDFVLNTGPLAVAAFIVNLLVLYLCFKSTFARCRVDSVEFMKAFRYLRPPPKTAIRDARTMHITLGIFIFSMALLVLHNFLKISVAFIGILGAVLTMLSSGGKFPDMLERLDYRTIIFFGGLFIIVGGLEKTGVTADLAGAIGFLSGGSTALAVTIILWTAAVFSALIDNVPLAAAMVPIIRSLSETTGMGLGALAWASCLGCDIGGSASPIGASANIVGLSQMERCGVRVSWREYCRAAVPATVLALITCNILLVIRYAL